MRDKLNRTRYVKINLIVLVASWLMTTAQAADLPTFHDATDEAGIVCKHSFGDFELDNIVEGTGAGAMFFDYDNDGWLDIYLPNGSWLSEVNDNRGRSLRGKLKNHLYRNKRDGTFEDVTDRAGVGDESYSLGCSAADFDDDGDQDLYVLNYNENVFYQNNGDGTFTDISVASGLNVASWSLCAPWFDYDSDGDLDVFVANYLQYDGGKFRSFYAAAGYPGPLSYPGSSDMLFENNGDGTFTDVSVKAGVSNPDGRGMSAAISDLDGDGRLDIYVANDAMENYYYRNQGDGTFANEGLFRGLAFGEGGQGVSSMGPTIGDVDRDSKPDIYIPDMGYGCLLMNRGSMFEDFTSQGNLAIVCGQYTGWGGVLTDYDNDGYLDIFVANGNAHHEYSEEDVLMHNDGTGRFVDVALQSGDYFHQKYVGRGATFGDYDNDGDMDLLVVNVNDRPRLLRNDGGNTRHWLRVTPMRAGGKSYAFGATVVVETDWIKQVATMMPVNGYLSQGDPRLLFGLADTETVKRVEVIWPDGTKTEQTNLKSNQSLVITQDSESGQ
ncbi:CRTAC1 family protein [Novipirellula artificiosorum]|uniref:FG-GAP repeat protein n=1 Tax=Novipirellula artificiosorum TaxID=2528016 RepID=A0A5C6DIG5_9BACT|nr:CRTAC1 family protein [Novipirellula artificiosorum]TWU35995.1 FG-GAP repeat protein [Novipirellula artificiosorum]